MAELAISAVLPCFEEAHVLRSVVGALQGALWDTTSEAEIILVVSEAARDGTPGVADALAAETPGRVPVRGLRQAADDPGYGRAVALGFGAARYAWLLLYDADGQFHSRDLHRLVSRTDDADLVLGVRQPRRDPWIRRACGAVYTRTVTRLLGLGGVRDLDCAFKLLRRECLGPQPLQSRTGVINAEILRRARAAGARLTSVPVTHLPRPGGATRLETRLGPLHHLPRPQVVVAMARDLVALTMR